MAPYSSPSDVQLAIDELERRLRPLIVQLQGSLVTGQGDLGIVAPWAVNSGTDAESWTRLSSGLVIVNMLLKTTAGAFFTQDVVRGMPVPRDGRVLVVTQAALSTAARHMVRFDVNASGNLTFEDQGVGFPNGAQIAYVPVNFSYMSAIPR